VYISQINVDQIFEVNFTQIQNYEYIEDQAFVDFFSIQVHYLF